MMNMRRLLSLFVVTTFIFLISSCAVQPIQKRLIGTWKPVKVEPIIVPGTQEQVVQKVQETKSNKLDTVDYQAKPREITKADEQKERMIQSELRSTMTVYANKTAIKEYPGKTVHATWKLKNKGTNLLVNTKETGKKITFNILHVNDTSAIFTATSPVGRYKITYKKVKK
jgi:hypothetical protein